MSNGLSIDELMAAFPDGRNHRAVLEWLVQVFELWGGGANLEVTNKKDEIASLVGRGYKLLPNPNLSTLPPITRIAVILAKILKF
ncbi:MAG TPA: hypothetical protein VFT87_01310 [Candidatus Saccharimonadales bacterium]|nr:hypothetical protein [Candidatus Saccharimonadales bacterium]